MPSEDTTANKTRPTEAESRKMQRAKNRILEVAKLNIDMKKPTQTMINNKKDRKILVNQVICSQYSMTLKTRTQRTDVLKFLLSIVDDPIKNAELITKLKSFLEFELEPIDLCDTSSDEEEERLVPMSAVTQSSTESKISPTGMRHRLPGRVEKWNDEADSDEGEYGPGEGDD